MTDADADAAAPAPAPAADAHSAAPPLALGFAALGRPGYLTLTHARDLGPDISPEALEARAHRLLDLAWDLGWRAFDTARGYGRGEAFLAAWLRSRAIAPGSVRVSSKWGYRYVAGWRSDAPVHEVKDHSAEMLDRQWAETEALLGPWLSLWQIHSATLQTGVLEDPAVLSRLARLRDRGLPIGLSLTGLGQAATLARALEVAVDGRPLFSAVQATANLQEVAALSMLRQARAAGWEVLVKEVHANGRLLTGEPLAVLSRIGAGHGVGADAIAIAWVLAQGFATCVISGAATEEHLRQNHLSLGVRLTEADQEALSSLARPSAAYWAERAALAWS